VTSTLEQSTPRTARYGLAALLPLALAGLIITAVLTVLVGVIGLVIGLVVTAVAVVVRARTFDTGLDAAILRDLGAAPAEGPDAAGLVNLAEGLSATAGVPVPDLFVIDTPSINLLVVGTDPDDAAIVATSGLLGRLSRVELEAVVARAFVQLRQGDVFAATMSIKLESSPVTRVFASMLGHDSDLDDPDRDVLLDRAAVMLTRYPPGLVGALQSCREVGSIVSASPASMRRLWLVDPLGTDTQSLDHRMEAIRLL